jgi:hypothetical protein
LTKILLIVFVYEYIFNDMFFLIEIYLNCPNILFWSLPKTRFQLLYMALEEVFIHLNHSLWRIFLKILQWGETEILINLSAQGSLGNQNLQSILDERTHKIFKSLFYIKFDNFPLSFWARKFSEALIHRINFLKTFIDEYAMLLRIYNFYINFNEISLSLVHDFQ